LVDNSILSPCFGLHALGLCNYNPAAPTSIYFSVGQAIGALAFTIAVQQLLRPIYRFRLTARYLSLPHLYALVFAAVLATAVATAVPSFPSLHGGPWGYAIVWELVAAILFAVAYGAVGLAIVLPIRVKGKTTRDFARGVATLLSAADEVDHVDLLADLRRSLSRLITFAAFVDRMRETTAFFDFTYRREIARGAYAASLLRIIADPSFCETLVRRAPWQVATTLRDMRNERLHTESAEQFVRQLARQAILRDDSIMTREIGYQGFGSAPLLSESLFSGAFIIEMYNPFDTLGLSSELITPSILRRFNNAAKRCYQTLIRERNLFHSQAAFSIQSAYRSALMVADSIQKDESASYHIPLEINIALQDTVRLANHLQAATEQYDSFFVNNPNAYRHDVLETLVEIVYEGLLAISNRFKGFDDPFWFAAIEAVSRSFPSVGQQPSGLTPFQQRLALKLIEKLQENMRGFYPAVCRVLLSCVGPYQRPSAQPNQTAFNIIKDAMYIELQKLQQADDSFDQIILHKIPTDFAFARANTARKQR
jgi:hypothetical protein